MYIDKLKVNGSTNLESLFSNGFISLAKVWIDNGLTIQDIKTSIEEAMIINLVKENGKITNNEISFRTGIDRRTVSSLRKNNFNVKKKPDKYSLFISYLKEHQEKENDGFPISIIKYRELFKKHLNGSNSPDITLKTIISEGYAKRKGDFINVLSYGRVNAVDNKSILTHLGNLIERAVTIKYLNKSKNINITDRAIIFRDIPSKSINKLDKLTLEFNQRVIREFIQMVEPFCDPKGKINGECLSEYGMYYLNHRKE